MPPPSSSIGESRSSSIAESLPGSANAVAPCSSATPTPSARRTAPTHSAPPLLTLGESLGFTPPLCYSRQIPSIPTAPPLLLSANPFHLRLRDHPLCSKTVSNCEKHQDIKSLAKALTDLSIGRQRYYQIPMVGQQGIRLAISLIADHFGDVVAKVCECLIRRGSLSFPEVARFTELSQGQVKNCLLVLIQHNCVQAFSVPKRVGMGGTTKPTTLYMTIFDNIIHRMRFSKFLFIVKEHFVGSEYAELLEGFLQHGRLTFELLYDRASGLNGGKGKRDDVLAMFNELVHAHYVERCPKGEPFLESKADFEGSSVKTRTKSSGENRTTEQEALIAAAPSDADRFSGIMDMKMETEADVKDDSSLEVSAGNKRKYEVLETDKDIQNTIDTKEILWRANYEKFIKCLKKKACVANVRSRFSPDAAIVLEAMIESSDHKNAKTMNSVTSSMNSILESVRGKPGGISLTLDHVRAILELLGCQLCTTDEMGALYTIVLKGIIETCQNDEVESLVLKKYGKEAYRIFRLLTKMGRPVPTDQISDNTFLEKKEAQKILCKLWKDVFLDMDKVNLNSGARSEVFYWKVNKKELWEHVLEDMFHTALNINQKIAQIAEEWQVFHADGQKADRLKRARRILESSLLKMDDVIMLFHDF